MACEKNRNKAATAARSTGGIPGAANKFSHIAAGGVDQRGTSEVEAGAPVALPVEPTRTGLETPIKSPGQRTIELVKDIRRQQAMGELQEKYTSLQVSPAELKKVLGAGANYEHLVDESWLAEGPLVRLFMIRQKTGSVSSTGSRPG